LRHWLDYGQSALHPRIIDPHRDKTILILSTDDVGAAFANPRLHATMQRNVESCRRGEAAQGGGGEDRPHSVKGPTEGTIAEAY
jgi:hypothetical protein